MELSCEELDSSLIEKGGWAGHFNLIIDNMVWVLRMVHSTVIMILFWKFKSHAGIGECLLWRWKLRRKEEEEGVSSTWREMSL